MKIWQKGYIITHAPGLAISLASGARDNHQNGRYCNLFSIFCHGIQKNNNLFVERVPHRAVGMTFDLYRFQYRTKLGCNERDVF
jgi:hypothetical protein